jgi:CheY-like chemotaxis protein
MDEFSRHRTLGEILLIDRLTNATSACGIVEKAKTAREDSALEVTRALRSAQKHQTPAVVLTASLSMAKAAETQLHRYGRHTMTLERPENASSAIHLLLEAGLIVLVPKSFVTAAVLSRLSQEEKVLDLTQKDSLSELF